MKKAGLPTHARRDSTTLSLATGTAPQKDTGSPVLFHSSKCNCVLNECTPGLADTEPPQPAGRHAIAQL